MYMFKPGDNDGYFALGERARDLVVEWIGGGQWYRESEPKEGRRKELMRLESGEEMDVEDGGKRKEGEMSGEKSGGLEEELPGWAEEKHVDVEEGNVWA